MHLYASCMEVILKVDRRDEKERKKKLGGEMESRMPSRGLNMLDCRNKISKPKHILKQQASSASERKLLESPERLNPRGLLYHSAAGTFLCSDSLMMAVMAF